ncbi:hypothetical protein H257_15147 [Aphanomyces astaci]|uniref:Uncharacterized protein n=1 Tax=Aphanomyces astaci TaxID=112090 RepID=W4FND3_APHAT|nr:hypothetical protein H257_15147 [Aphanomyces astaci]ETV68997.1 hypothetical protein H257_15147 [Aphanomyces astaci]|eukprot:XP_009841456.1 hypothetical protein H257_15147 [Aphanomyces astaci]
MSEPRFSAKSNWLKPRLTDANIKLRLEFAMSFLRSGPGDRRVFSDMHDIVHVDEKWFYLTKNKNVYYIYDDEVLAIRSVQSKSHITKASVRLRPPRNV